MKQLKLLMKKSLYILRFIPLIRTILETKDSQTPVKFKMWFIQKILRFNRGAYWPVHHSSIVSFPEKIMIGIDTCPGYMPGCYIQGVGGLIIEDYSQISANVGIITQNHDPHDLRLHTVEECPSVKIGAYCWIGMNSIILPNVTLGDFTIVGAGSVVTKSFEEGYCIIAGNPAKIIKTLDKEKCTTYRNPILYNGYIKHSKMEVFSRKHINF